MRNVMIRILLPALSLALVGAVSLAAAQGPGPGSPPQQRGIERMAQRLDLSDEQVAQIKAMREEGQAEQTKLRKQLMQLRSQFESEMLKDDLDENTLKNLTEQMGEVRIQMQLLRLEHRLAMRKVLTDEQWDKLLTSRKGPGGGRRGHGPRGLGPGGPEAGNWRDR